MFYNDDGRPALNRWPILHALRYTWGMSGGPDGGLPFATVWLDGQAHVVQQWIARWLDVYRQLGFMLDSDG